MSVSLTKNTPDWVKSQQESRNRTSELPEWVVSQRTMSFDLDEV